MPRQNRPNILLITTDQHRGDCLGIEGHPVAQTPNLDWLARTGTRFRRGYSECPSCIPARRVLMSGQAPAVNGMVGMTAVEWDPPYTLAGELSRAGYQTQLIGKLHFMPYRKRYGFDHMELADGSRKASGPVPQPNDYVDWLVANTGMATVDPAIAHGVSANGWVGRPSHLPEHLTHTSWCASKALEFLQRRDPEAPFFLNLSFIDPHPPLTPPPVYYERYINQDLPGPVVGDWAPAFDGPEKGIDIDDWRISLDEVSMKQARAGYYGLINHVDDQVGRVVDALRRRGLLDDTVILFTADHGEMLGDHNMYRKTFPYEGSARVPFFVRPAAGMDCPAEVVSQAPVGLQDVLPTLLDAAGIEIPHQVTGRSLVPLMRGDPDVPWRDVLHGEHTAQYRAAEGMHFLTDGHSKYVWYSQTGREHLFNLDEDPYELHDLSLDGDGSLIEPWRERLAGELKDRPEGFVQDGRLVVGRPHDKLLPHYRTGAV
ncbi:arylsulfatase [Jiangella asiatica]|uniref:Arylsulfatase n=1 Tax=Jiangella asiatica TaxID=2530372 RepID=A0A4R5CS44_9ACTN|nr:arylsulfatase [Jiangella asiatica]TDE03096.1 arylsulfatase [Jiangella asiatica]